MPPGRRRIALLLPLILCGLTLGCMNNGSLQGAATPGEPASGPTPEPISWGEMQEAMAGRPIPPATATFRYGEGSNRFAELRLPSGDGPFPVAAVLHGGCWLSIADLTYMHAFSEALLERGWAVWSLEFNRIDEPDGAWPGILEDVAAGMDYLREASAEYPLDLDRVVAMGHSSGGHLAFWAAGRPGLPPDDPEGPRLRRSSPLPVAGVVGLAPIADLRDYTQYTRCGPSAVQDFLGSADLDGRRMHLSDPAALIPGPVPQLLLFGEQDPIVPPAHGLAYLVRRQAFAREARTQAARPTGPAGVSAQARDSMVRSRTIRGAGHFELVAPFTKAWDAAAAELDAWLEEIIAAPR